MNDIPAVTADQRREQTARTIMESFQKKLLELNPDACEPVEWDEDGEGADEARECFRAAAEAVLAHSALQRDETTALALLRELNLLVDFGEGWESCGCFPNASSMAELCQRVAAFIAEHREPQCPLCKLSRAKAVDSHGWCPMEGCPLGLTRGGAAVSSHERGEK